MRLLFVCTHNRCRSILCEAVCNQLAAGRIQAFSAGSEPAGEVHPLTLRYLAQRGYHTDGLASESWNSYQQLHPDLVVTVCDTAAGEACPLWLGDCTRLHWSLPDPSRTTGSSAIIETAFLAVIDRIESLLGSVLEQSIDSLRGEELRESMASLGRRN